MKRNFILLTIISALVYSVLSLAACTASNNNIPEKTTKYICPKDLKEYDTAEEAAACCGVQTVTEIIEKFICPVCSKEYETADEAKECCGSEKETETVTKYVCPSCTKEYETVDEAKECCGAEKVVETVTKYVCPTCEKEYETAVKAKECCGAEKVVETVTKYVCPNDSKEFNTAEEAAGCCGVQTTIVTKYICPTCSAEYDTADEAATCCGAKIEYVYGCIKGSVNSVKHFQQTKDQTGYELVAAESENWNEGTGIDDITNGYTGFDAVVLSQYGTTAYVFYDRKVVTYTFETGENGTFTDGSTSKSVTGVYGAEVPSISKVTSSCATFNGWKASTVLGIPVTFGDESLLFHARWLAWGYAPEGFVYVPGKTITGSESWTPESNLFTEGKEFIIPDLLVSKYEVTRGDIKDVLGYDFSLATTDGDPLKNPASHVNFYKAIAYCNARSIKEDLDPCYTIDGSTDPSDWGTIPSSKNETWNSVTCDFTAEGYRMPTEAEWEYLARGNEEYLYSGSDTLADVAWNNTSLTDGTSWTKEVGLKQSNGFGIYDMSGNIWEIVWNEEAYALGKFMIRGGSYCTPEVIRNTVNYRHTTYYDNHSGNQNFGLRVVRTAK